MALTLVKPAVQTSIVAQPTGIAPSTSFSPTIAPAPAPAPTTVSISSTTSTLPLQRSIIPPPTYAPSPTVSASTVKQTAYTPQQTLSPLQPRTPTLSPLPTQPRLTAPQPLLPKTGPAPSVSQGSTNTVSNDPYATDAANASGGGGGGGGGSYTTPAAEAAAAAEQGLIVAPDALAMDPEAARAIVAEAFALARRKRMIKVLGATAGTVVVACGAVWLAARFMR
jgi:hypothetical protein